MSGVLTGGRTARYAGVAAALLALVVAGAGLFFLSGPLISAVHAVTKGSWGADLALGIGFVLVPLAVICAYGYLARRFHAEVRALVPEVEPLPDPARPPRPPAEPLTLF